MIGATTLVAACGPLEAICRPRDACGYTPTNPEGPYYREGAPERADLNVLNRPGEPMVLSGRVLSEGCSRPVEGARLDFWHADGDGVYDLDTGDYGLRGWQRSDANGSYVLRSVQPGAYAFGPMMRARHIHVKITAPGHRPFTTQLYAEGDPVIHQDAQFVCGLDVAFRQDGGALVGNFDFVLRPA